MCMGSKTFIVTKLNMTKRSVKKYDMKILLIAFYTKSMYTKHEEIGISSVASYVREKGYHVKLMSCIDFPDYELIKEYSPDIIGFNVYKITVEHIKKSCDKISVLLPHAVICLGGIEATASAVDLLKKIPTAKIAVRGEGEESFLYVIKALERKNSLYNIRGITFRENDKIIENNEREAIKDIDILPDPSRDLLVQNKLKLAHIITSRGCEGHCTFCSSRLMSKTCRERSIDKILNEINHIYDHYKIDTFFFRNSSFEAGDNGIERITKIAEGIIQRKLKITYFTFFRAEFSKIATPEVMALLKKSGLFAGYIGIDAANEEDLKLYGKMANNEDNHNIIKLFKKYNIGAPIGFIFYNPYSTLNTLKKNVAFLKRYNYIFVFTNYQLIDGTPLALKVERDGLINQNSFEGYNFKDENVGHTIHYIKKFTAEHSFYANALDALFSLARDVEFLIPHLYQLCANNNRVIKILDQYMENNWIKITVVNEIIAAWIEGVLDLSSRFNKNKLDSYSDDYWENKKLDTLINELLMNRNKLHIDLFRNNLIIHNLYEKILI